VTIAAEHFGRVATVVSDRTAELLGAQVAVVDHNGVVVASNIPGAVGAALDMQYFAREPAVLRLPIRLEAQNGEVVVRVPENGEPISPRLTQVLVDLIVNQTAVLARLPNQHELKNKFIHDLLRGPGADEADILREATILGMDLTRPRAVILIDASAYILQPDQRRVEAGDGGQQSDPRAYRRAQLVIASVVGFFNLPDDTICAYIGDGEVAVLKASSTQDLAAWTDGTDSLVGSSASWANLAALKRAGAALRARLEHEAGAAIGIGIGRYHPGVQELARSYQDARAALSLGRRFHGPSGVHCLDSLGLAAFVGVSDERTKVELATHLLSPLDQEPDLLATLAAFFAANCAPSLTAHHLAIHRNTLSYRLDKITSLTGLDPRRFDDGVQIRVALLLRSLSPTLQ